MQLPELRDDRLLHEDRRGGDDQLSALLTNDDTRRRVGAGGHDPAGSTPHSSFDYDGDRRLRAYGLVPDWDSTGTCARGFCLEKIEPLRLLQLPDTFEKPKSTSLFRLPRGVYYRLNF